MIKERIWHAEKGQDVLKVFGTSAETGLTPEQVEELRTQCGFNELQSAEKKGMLRRFIQKIKIRYESLDACRWQHKLNSLVKMYSA